MLLITKLTTKERLQLDTYVAGVQAACPAISL